MRALRMTLAVAALAVLALPATALAKPVPQPLVDAAPLGTSFKDRVTSTNRLAAHAAATANWAAYRAADGTTIAVAISSQYAGTIDQTVAQSYVDFLASLTHGPELSSLKVYIAPPDEVQQNCGGQPGTLACYDSTTRIMTVPGEQVQTPDGVTTSYVVAHEYGHHIAAFRSNSPFRAFSFGPKYWASYELVCDRTLAGLLAPGNESAYYLQNPGESWAETYAQLKYPDVQWQYTPLLKPDAGAFSAAQQDVLQPWSGPVTKVVKGSFAKRGRNVQTFSFPITLDGSLSVKMYGPRGTNYNFIVRDGGTSGKWTTSPNSRDSVAYQAVCRQTTTETVSITVKCVKGSGPYTLRVKYDG